MSQQCQINLRCNCSGLEKEQLYEEITIDCEFQIKNLNKYQHQMATKLNRSSTPFIVLQFPTLDFQGAKINLPTILHQNAQVKVENRLYQWYNFKSKQTINFNKKVSQSFQKLSHLKNNEGKLELKIYDIKKMQENQQLPVNQWISQLLDHSKINGIIKTDPQLVSTFKQIIKKVSPLFEQSPIMALLDLFSSIETDLQQSQILLRLQSLKNLSPQHINWLCSGLKRKKCDQKTQRLLKQCKKNLILNVFLDKLFRLKIEIPCILFAYLMPYF